MGVKALDSIVRAICKPFEKNVRNCKRDLKVPKMLILVISIVSWPITKIRRFFKTGGKALVTIARAICKPFEKNIRVVRET